MRIRVKLSSDMKNQLAAEAKERGVKLEHYVQRLLSETVSPKAGKRSRASQDEFRAFLDALANKAPDVPHLRAEKFSRETIYRDHNQVR